MSFNQYKNVAQVQQEFNIKYQEDNFLQISSFKPRQSFLDDLKFALESLDVFSSEAARCEVIIFPVLKEVYKHYATNYELWIQKTIFCDELLNGVPDYMISKRSDLGKTILELPIVMIVEAKKNDFEQGWGQCLAELIAARELNKTGKVYGIVTDGKYWEFGYLLDDVFTKNLHSLSLDRLTEELLGGIDFIFKQL
ncbi:hypothetical protein QUF74_12510 [Candidatus Halobeggiatoa sp. HSG11]|nr:hypothetical protein [Candidatus Halobeggiatoa sp. HSG11]